MNSISSDQNLSTDIIKMPENISTIHTNQPLTTITLEDIDIITDEKDRLDDLSLSPIHHTDDLPSIVDRKQKSLISIYDNNLPQQSHPLIGIIGRNQRSQAFTKRLLLSGFSNPILCDINSNEINSNEKFNYVSYETFYQFSPTIVLITDNLMTNFEDLFPQNKQQLIIDTREISSLSVSSIPGSHQAFGNLSNWEIENGTQRIGVAVEQLPPLNLMKFIYDLNCFSRGILFLDHYSYNNQQIKSFRNCLFPLISTIIIFTLCFIISIIEHRHDFYSSVLIYRQASSITASTSITLLSLLFLIRPVVELIEIILKKQNKNEKLLPNFLFIQRWLQTRRYLSWYSLSFALLHIIFIIFSKIDLNSKLLIYALFFGIFTLIVLLILSFVHFPWISERLLWSEYRFLTSHLGPFCLFFAFIHLYLYWKFHFNVLNLKFLSMILPLIVLLLRFIIYGLIHPILKLSQWIKTKKDTSLVP